MSFYTGYSQKNGAVSKVNNKFISHLTRAQRTPSAAATVNVSHASQSCSSIELDRTCYKRRQPPSPSATLFAESNTMRFLSLGVR